MNDIKSILLELNESNSTNYKKSVLEKYKDNELLKRVFKMALCKVSFTYGVTMKNVKAGSSKNTNTLEWGLDALLPLSTREITGNNAISQVKTILEAMSENDREVIELILGRDLKVRLGRTEVNKVWKNLIVKPPYMRCDTYSTDKEVNGKLKKGTNRNINFPAFIQLKADGMFQAVTVEQGKVTFTSRSGEERELPHLEKSFSEMQDGVYIGELLVNGMTNRSESNGLINSDDPKDDVYIQLWDFVNLQEYADAKHQNKSIERVTYENRFIQLKENTNKINNKNIRLIPSMIVNNVTEALAQVNEWMKDGFEGGILKDFNNVFKDTTSKTQLKLKLVIDAEVRITGFQEGTPGTKREQTFGAMIFETDDGKVKGRTSGFTDKQLEDFNSRRDELIGQLITVEFNDVTKSRDNDYFALSHPRFIEVRTDKNETDTLERIFDMRDMAMAMKEKDND